MSDMTLRRLETYDDFAYKVVTEDVPEMVTEDARGEKVVVPATKKIMMKGILQKADTLNQNGRIYPLSILEREIRNYQKFILENRAIGELDHPDCVPPETEILTRSGWKVIETIEADEVVATLNVRSNEIEYQTITEKIDQRYVGDMYRFKNARTYDMLLTPAHRILAWDRSGVAYFVTAEEAYHQWRTKDSRLSHSGLRRSGTWVGEDLEVVEIAGRPIDASLWAAFLGIYLAEGYCNGIKSGKVADGTGHVTLTQKKPEGRRLIEDLIALLPFASRVDVRDDGETNDYHILDPQLRMHLLPLGDSRSKRMPSYAKGWSPRLLQVLLDWMLLGDGRNRMGYKQECVVPEYCTTSKQLADDVYEVMLKLGSGATVHTYQPSDRAAPDHAETGRMILSENSEPMNIVYQHSTVGMSLDVRFMHAEVVPYDGRVYCVKVPNGTWMMRHNGKACWTGNSSVVNLKNVSHVIREAYLENGTVIGTIEVLDKTPSGATLKGLVESGIKLGISSRGVGSTRKQGDYHVVQDDFQLITFDMVSEPSTPGAFMIPEGKTIDADELKQVFNRADRLDRVLNDILSCRKAGR